MLELVVSYPELRYRPHRRSTDSGGECFLLREMLMFGYNRLEHTCVFFVYCKKRKMRHNSVGVFTQKINANFCVVEPERRKNNGRAFNVSSTVDVAATTSLEGAPEPTINR